MRKLGKTSSVQGYQIEVFDGERQIGLYDFNFSDAYAFVERTILRNPEYRLEIKQVVETKIVEHKKLTLNEFKKRMPAASKVHAKR